MNLYFDHEKLDVYGVELEFVAWTTVFFDDACESPALHKRELLDQLDHSMKTFECEALRPLWINALKWLLER
jgi:hypothetical protein